MAKKKNIQEDGSLLVYSYNPETKEFIGEDKAFKNPLEPGKFLIPAWATDVEPPAAQNGKVRKWTGTEWVFEDAPQPTAPPVDQNTDEQKAARARFIRNGLLAQTDWRKLSDVPAKHKGALWDDYRQALRDVPQQDGFPNTITWPTQP